MSEFRRQGEHQDYAVSAAGADGSGCADCQVPAVFDWPLPASAYDFGKAILSQFLQFGIPELSAGNGSG